MKQLLITTLGALGYSVFLQGTLNSVDDYPDSFITFWTDDTEDGSHFNNDATSFVWYFTVNFYSNDPSLVGTVPSTIKTALKNVGFIPQGKGSDLPSDVITHTGWTMDFRKIEYVTTNTTTN